MHQKGSLQDEMYSLNSMDDIKFVHACILVIYLISQCSTSFIQVFSSTAQVYHF